VAKSIFAAPECEGNPRRASLTIEINSF